MDQPPENSVFLKLQKTCECGFTWAFEMRNGNATRGRLELYMLEENLTKLMKSARGKEYTNNSLQEKEVRNQYVIRTVVMFLMYVLMLNNFSLSLFGFRIGKNTLEVISLIHAKISKALRTKCF